ncbi:hypothetical protein IWX91DRAFT_317936 [Phyllosticta citricarpa]
MVGSWFGRTGQISYIFAFMHQMQRTNPTKRRTKSSSSSRGGDGGGGGGDLGDDLERNTGFRAAVADVWVYGKARRRKGRKSETEQSGERPCVCSRDRQRYEADKLNIDRHDDNDNDLFIRTVYSGDGSAGTNRIHNPQPASNSTCETLERLRKDPSGDLDLRESAGSGTAGPLSTTPYANHTTTTPIQVSACVHAVMGQGAETLSVTKRREKRNAVKMRLREGRYKITKR